MINSRVRARLALIAALTATACAIPAVSDAAVPSLADDTWPSAETPVAGDLLDIDILPDGTTVQPGTGVSVPVKYTCTDTSGAHNVTITVTLDQNGSGGHVGTVDVPCQVTAGTATVQVPFTDAVQDTQIDAFAQIDDYADDEQSAMAADLVAHRALLSANPNPSVADGVATVTGDYTCDDTTPEAVTVLLQQVNAGTQAAGLTTLDLPCPAQNAPWTTTVSSSTKGVFTSGPPFVGAVSDYNHNVWDPIY